MSRRTGHPTPGHLKPESVRQLAAFAQGEADAKAARPDVQHTYTDPTERAAYAGGYGYGRLSSRAPIGDYR